LAALALTLLLGRSAVNAVPANNITHPAVKSETGAGKHVPRKVTNNAKGTKPGNKKTAKITATTKNPAVRHLNPQPLPP
jgi:hypothetical protein